MMSLKRRVVTIACLCQVSQARGNPAAASGESAVRFGEAAVDNEVLPDLVRLGAGNPPISGGSEK
jgi:hypothetical protein